MFERILLAVDAGDAGSVATSFTIALAKTCGATVHVLHVDRSLLACGATSSRPVAEAAGVVTAALEELHAAGVRAKGITYRTSPMDLPAAVCDLAEDCLADVIVVGSHRRRLRRLLSRSTTTRIARHTPLPVITAPPPLGVRARDQTLGRVPPFLELPARSPEPS